MAARELENSALVLVDVQNDFCPGGALGVPEADKIVSVINRYVEVFQSAGRPVYATRDWHPPVTRHFKAYGGLWPPHCVQDSRGADFHPDLRLPDDAIIVSKGMNPEEDSYSAFQAREEDGAPLEESLRQRGIEHLYVAGLATDYCVKFSAADAMRKGFGLTVLLDAVRGVNLRPHDSEEAIEDAVRSGAEVTTIERLQEQIGKYRSSAPSDPANDRRVLRPPTG